MKKLSAIAVVLILAAPICTAETKTYTVERSITVAASAEEVWQVIGDFCDFDDWHPAFTGCALKALEGGGAHRLLTMEGGATFLEKLIASEPGLSYTYSIVEAPVPLMNYVGTMAITQGDGTVISWSSRFKSDDPEMEALVAGVYDSGLAALQARFDR